MSREAESMKRLRAARKAKGLKEFRAWVEPIRFDYLTECLDKVLCRHCGREWDECTADPCSTIQHKHDAYVGEEEHDRTH